MERRVFSFLFSLAIALSAVAASAQTMPLSEIQKGMRGYGETVFDGTRLEKFDVEIIGVLHNIGPSQDLILAKVDSPEVRRAGVVAGMSGSPIYIDGKVIGALAYAWQFAKEPVAGITPIEEMLKIAEAGSTDGAAVPASSTEMSASKFLSAIADHKTDALFETMVGGLKRASQATALSTVKPIAVPLSLSSFAPETIARFSKYLDGMGFVAVPSGSSSGSATAAPATGDTGFHPGDAIGAVLLNGDFNVAATGTVTFVDGHRVYAFGHPFLDMGSVSFPMAKSEIVGVMPSLSSSFKFANTGAVVGSFRQDRSTGIMGVVGDQADMIPIDLTVEGSGPAKSYHVNIVRHSMLSPLILAMAADTVVANAQRAAGERTVLLDSEIRVKGFDQPIHLREGWAGAQARQAIPAYLAVVAGYVMSNEFQPAEIESIRIHLRHEDQVKTAKLLEASVEPTAKGEIHPGDVVKVRTVLKPYRGDPFVETFDVKIPDNQPAGPAYVLVGSGTVLNQVDFSLVPPDPQTLQGVIAVLERLRPSTDLTLGLYTSDDGAVTAGVYLPNLPPSMRAVVTGDKTSSSQSSVRYYAAEHLARSLGYIIDGAMKIDLNIKPRI
ncbi:MAG TPA: SpoIVB peptidase S55 domain-containing protein [Thermoanaerobaculia bacterium]|nr:SpoIVB peptidase S55 domain-containing protein [Thermoanaerobaculia bacterium]